VQQILLLPTVGSKENYTDVLQAHNGEIPLSQFWSYENNTSHAVGPSQLAQLSLTHGGWKSSSL